MIGAGVLPIEGIAIIVLSSSSGLPTNARVVRGKTAGVLNLNNGAIGAILNGITKNGGTEIDGVDGADSWVYSRPMSPSPERSKFS